MSKKVVVFGATGLLGQHVWQAAVAAGHSVAVLVRSPAKLADVPDKEQLTIIQGDVMDASIVQKASSGADIAISCVSPAGGNSTIEMVRSIVPNAAQAGVLTFYLVGGSGALWVPGSGRTKIMAECDDLAPFGVPPQVPVEAIRNMTKGHVASMEYMATTGYAHTYICPSFMVEGGVTVGRSIGFEARMDGTSVGGKVNLGDVAQVIVDDLPYGKLLGERVRVESGAIA